MTRIRTDCNTMSGPPDSSLPILLSTLTASLDSAAQVLPDATKLHQPEHGLSLLNTKNELFLSYLENLVFLILVKLRHLSATDDPGEGTKLATLHRAAVEKLAELRVLLDRGVRPLEARLKYQVDKVVRAASDAARPAVARRAVGSNGTRPWRKGGDDEEKEDGSCSDDESPAASDSSADELAFRPNPSSLLRGPLPSAPAGERPRGGRRVRAPAHRRHLPPHHPGPGAPPARQGQVLPHPRRVRRHRALRGARRRALGRRRDPRQRPLDADARAARGRRPPHEVRGGEIRAAAQGDQTGESEERRRWEEEGGFWG